MKNSDKPAFPITEEETDRVVMEPDVKIGYDDKPRYVIGVDTYDKGANSYCIVRNIGSSAEIIHQKTMGDEKEFKEEVMNLSKYFNAKIIE